MRGRPTKETKAINFTGLNYITRWRRKRHGNFIERESNTNSPLICELWVCDNGVLDPTFI